MTKYLPSSALCLNIILKASVYFWSVSRGLATDIEELSPLVDRSLGYDVHIPVLACHSKNTGYHKVTWYKDGVVVQNGSANLSGHVLSLGTLLAKPFPNVFNSPLKLQGYYWCDIDLNFTTKTPEKYLFQIQSVLTYRGSIVARNDYLGNATNQSFEESVEDVMKKYENDLQDILFGFLPQPNTFVTHINKTAFGLVVNFFLYAHRAFDPRQQPYAYRLSEDESQLKFIYDYLNNQTSTAPEYMIQMREWTQQHGVSFIDIKISSTAGCYREMSGSGKKNLTWPYTLTGDIVVTEEGCMTEDKLPVARACMGSFTNGAQWGRIEGTCAVYPHNRSAELIALLTSPGTHNTSEDIRKLEMLTDNPKELNVLDLHLVTSVLQDISGIQSLSTSEIDAVFTSIDNVLHTNITTLNTAKRTLRLSSRMLEVIDQITSSNSNKELNISKSSVIIAVKGTQTTDDLIVGVSVLPPEQRTSSPGDSVKFISNGSDVTAMQSVAGFVLPSDLIIKREKDLMFPCQLEMVYFSDWRLFADPKEVLRHRNYEASPTPVIHVGITGGPAWNLTNPIRFYFRNDFKSDIDEDPLCSYFDPKLDEGFGGWATEGCTMEGLHNGYYVCHCHHISMLSIIVPQKPGYLLLFRPSISVFIGCGISIAILSLVVLFYISSKTWRACENHHILFFLALALLCSLILLLAHNVESQWRPGCMFLTIVFHYFVQVTFCWLLVQSLVHHSRFCRNVEIVDMGKFLTRSNVFSWDFPFLIVGITWVVKGSDYYHHKVCWATMIEVSNIIVYPVVLLLLLTLCFNAIAVYYVTCGHFKDLELKTKRHGEATLKFRVAISIFVLFFLSWLFGYLSLHFRHKELQIAFGISIIVTSLYIFLFFVFHDISPRDLYAKVSGKKTHVGDSTDAIASDDVKTYNATEQ